MLIFINLLILLVSVNFVVTQNHHRPISRIINTASGILNVRTRIQNEGNSDSYSRKFNFPADDFPPESNFPPPSNFPPQSNFPPRNNIPPSFNVRVLTNEGFLRSNNDNNNSNFESNIGNSNRGFGFNHKEKNKKSDSNSEKFCECGYVNDDEPKRRVISGNEVDPPDRYPWMALITEDSNQLCGGAIISNQYIITAAHCLDICEEDLQKCKVKLGTYNVSESKTTYDIESIKKHEEYNLYANDIGLIKLKQPIVFNKSIRPICLPKKLKISQVIPYQEKIISAGWGLTKSGKDSEILQEFYADDWLKTDINKNKFCKELLCLRQIAGRFDSGDSGGPAWIIRSNRRAELVGVVSHYRLHRMRLSRVPLYVDWIKQNIKDIKMC